MKAKLKKFKTNYDLFVVNEDNQIETFASTDNTFVYKLSKQNCDEIFGAVDVEKLAMDWRESTGYHDADSYSDILGFNKAMELNRDKVFTLEDIKKAYIQGKHSGKTQAYVEFDDYIQSLQQPTEIEVEIKMEEYPELPYYKGSQPKLDSEGCLILKKI
jgi:hypothetical protein